jgi:hypothetical protein
MKSLTIRQAYVDMWGEADEQAAMSRLFDAINHALDNGIEDIRTLDMNMVPKSFKSLPRNVFDALLKALPSMELELFALLEQDERYGCCG